MTLREYINTYPRLERRLVRQRIADALNVSEPCIRHYANGTRTIPAKHLLALVEACEREVTIESLLQDVKAAA